MGEERSAGRHLLPFGLPLGRKRIVTTAYRDLGKFA
jgi:hypothetical protein